MGLDQLGGAVGQGRLDTSKGSGTIIRWVILGVIIIGCRKFIYKLFGTEINSLKIYFLVNIFTLQKMSSIKIQA